MQENRKFGGDDSYSRKEILDRKFSSNKYDEKYVIRSLYKDILDFQEYTKENTRRNKKIIDELMKHIQNSVNEVIPDFDVLIYLKKNIRLKCMGLMLQIFVCLGQI